MNTKNFKIDQPGICRRCGHQLKNYKSIKNGFGDSCLKKFIKENSLTIELFKLN